MHGYIEVVRGHGTGLFVAISPELSHEVIEDASSSQVCGELCKLLGIEKPNNSEWIRVI